MFDCKSLFDLFTLFNVNKYYKMGDEELEKEARKWNIGEYGDPRTGRISRQIIIDQLIKRHQANVSTYAICISLIAIIVSIIALIIKR